MVTDWIRMYTNYIGCCFHIFINYSVNDWLGDASTRFPLSFPHTTYSRAPDKPSKGEMRSKASSVSTRLSEFATESNRLRNKHAHRKYSNSFFGVKQTTHSRESYVSTCNEVCPRKILPPHFFTAHFTKAPPAKKTRMPALLFISLTGCMSLKEH